MDEKVNIETNEGLIEIETIEGLIEIEKGSIKWSVISAIGLFVIGLVVSGFIYLITISLGSLEKFITAIPGLAGTFVSSIPANEYFGKKKRIERLNLYRRLYSLPPVSKETKERFWKEIDEIK